ncbi:MAG: alkaline phosphatase family protein [Halobacteria archaeon]
MASSPGAAPPPDSRKALEEFHSRGLLREGTLFPDYDRGSIVSVGPTIARSLGLDFRGERALDLRERADHAVLLLVDSLSVDMARRLLREVPALRGALAESRVVTSTFPSVTPTGISSILSGLYPAEHAIPGFHFRLEGVERVIQFYRLSPAEQEEEGGLQTLGYDVARLGFDSLVTAAPREGVPARLAMPKKIAASLSTDLLRGAGLTGEGRGRGGVPVAAYGRHRDCLGAVPEGASGFTYAYFSAIDESLHLRGLHHRSTEQAFAALVATLSEWLERWREEALLFITSDHGHVDLRQPRVVDLHDPGLTKLMDLPPGVSGGRVAFFYTSKAEALGERLCALGGEDLWLLRPEEAVERGLLGPVPPSEEALARIGDLVAVARGSAYMRYRYSPKSPAKPDGATHSALSPEEMMVPLLLARVGKR